MSATTEAKSFPIGKPVRLIKKNARLVQSWIWPKTLEEFVRSRIHGYSLNVCAGLSEIGDVRLDLDPKDRRVIKGDMKALPFPDETFDTVIQDPPWKIPWFDRWKPFLECGRVCKVGGIVIYNSYWIPWSHQFRLDETWIRQDERFANTSIVSVLTRVRNSNSGAPVRVTHKSASRNAWVICPSCDREFPLARTDARFCSTACRMRAYRMRLRTFSGRT